MPSFGFFIISFVALLLVLGPSVILLAVGWRSGVTARVFSVLSIVVFLLFAWTFFTDPQAQGFEASAAYLYLTWGVTLHLGIFVFLTIKFTFSMAKAVWTRH